MRSIPLTTLFLLLAVSAFAGTVTVFLSGDSVPASSVQTIYTPPTVNENTVFSCPPGQAIFTGTNGSYCQ